MNTIRNNITETEIETIETFNEETTVIRRGIFMF